MNQTLISTVFPELGSPAKGKVRDIYHTDQLLVIICCDRISVFDKILPTPIPDKGKVLNLLSKFWFDHTVDIMPNHVIAVPDPNVLIAKRCRPIPLEVVVRGYIAGSMWRDYTKGKRKKCGIQLPEGLQQNDPLPHIIITPTTKNRSGHDTDISAEHIVEQGIISKILWDTISENALKLFQRGSEILNQRGMILVDTKYEFGIDNDNTLTLIDEIHTPDSSRFWYKDDPEKQFKDKEYARKWAIEKGFTGEEEIPAIPIDVQQKIRSGYLEIFQSVTGRPCPETKSNIRKRMRTNLEKAGILKLESVL